MPGDRQDLRRAVTRLAAEQHGYFTAAQARNVGYSYQAQKFHVDHSNWVRVERGLFRLPEWPVSDDDHLVRWTLWSRRQGVISHQSALAIHGLGDVDPARIHMSVPPGFRRTSSAVLLHHQTVPPREVEDRGAYRVTTPARAIAESAAESVPQELLDGAVAEAIDQGYTTRRRILDAAAALGPRAEVGIERALRGVRR